MTNYQSIPSYQDDDTGVDPVINDQQLIPDHGLLTKRRTLAGVFAFVFLVLGYVASYTDVGVTTSNATKAAFWGTALENGEKCWVSEKTACASNVCCPVSWGFIGVLGECKTCCSSQQCTPPYSPAPPAGEWGDAFCVNDTCASHLWEFAEPRIPKTGYPVWLPSETLDNSKSFRRLDMPRTVMEDTTPVFTQLWYFDFNEQEDSFNKDDIIITDTSISIPVWNELHASYSRSYNVYDEHETGIVTLVAGDNEMSLVTDYPMGSFVEKYHTLTYDGIKNFDRANYIQQKAKERINEPFDGPGWWSRAVAMFLASARRNIITAQVESGVDKALSWQLRRYATDYAAEDFGSVNPSTSEVWASHTENAKKAIELAKDPNFEREYLKSEQHCKHFEAGLGVDVIKNDEGVPTHLTFPLGRPFVTTSGEMVNAPVHYLGFVVGHVTAHYEDNILQLFFEGHSVSRQYSDVAFTPPYPNGLYVSPVAEGPDYVVDPDLDGRSDVYLKLTQPDDDLTMNDFTMSLGLVDVETDFTLWGRSKSEICDPDVIDDPMWEEIDLGSDDDSAFSKIAGSLQLAKGVVRGMPCADVWMRSDAGPATHSYDANEMGVWAHFLTEVPDVQTKPMGLGRFWDDWECFYQNKPYSHCRGERTL